MPFKSCSFWHPKDEGHPGEYEDACAVGDQRGIAAVADGVAGGMFSGRWARLLTQGAVDNPPDPRDPDALRGWLEPLRGEWDSGIDRPNLSFFQRRRLQEVGGGYATLQWVELLPPESADDESQEEVTIPYRSFAVGDCCLFHVRDGEVLRTFPMEKSKDFDLDPVSIGSVDRKQDRLLKFETLEATCRYGDLLVLASDALAWWMIRQVEEESPIPWDELWGMTEDEFADRVRSQRESDGMRHDDTTLVLLEVVSEVTEAEEPEVHEEEELEVLEGAVEEEPEEEIALAELVDDTGEAVEEQPAAVEQESETAGPTEEEPEPSEEETDAAGEEFEGSEVIAADSEVAEAAEESAETAEEEASATERTLEAAEQADDGTSPLEEETDAIETVAPNEDVSEERDTA
jgi:hypothetical protein